MRVKQVKTQVAEVVAPVCLIFSLAVVIFSFGACNRQDAKAVRFASTSSDAPANNAPLPNSSNSTAGPMVSFADVVNRVAPAVVTIHSESRVRAPQQFPFTDDPFFQEFFGNRGIRPPQPELRRQGLGSGVIVTSDGYILTNHHVIDGAEQIKVDLNDNRTLEAKVVGSDAPSDLAVLKVNASTLPVLSLGDSDRVRVGDIALALGNPLGIGQTVTMGIISAKGRTTGLSNGSFEDFLQTDAPINQGNSGGALVSTASELVGINSQILSPTGGSIGIGFAIPSNMARIVMDQLIANGRVRRGQLGVAVQKITSEVASKLGVQEGKGVLVAQVQPGGPADKAGIRQGDVIIAFNGIAVNDPNSFRNQVATTPPGTVVTVTILRNGRQQDAHPTLAEFVPQADQQGEQ